MRNCFVKICVYNLIRREVSFIRKYIRPLAMVLILAFLAGCQGPPKGPESSPGNNSPMPIDPNEQTNEVEIVLYFKHEVADYLVTEKRTVLQENETMEQMVVKELLKGPQIHERRLVMPPNTEIIDVSRQGDTVFVNLTNNFLGNIDLSTLPGKQNISEEDMAEVQANMKRLAIYSIVNSLTYINGVNQVKLLVGNRQMSYIEMNAEKLMGEQGTNIDPNSPMLPIRRNQSVNLTPSRSVRLLMNALVTEPDWDFIYLFLSNRTMDGSELVSLDEFKNRMPAVVGGMVEFEGNPVEEEEYLNNKAFVTVNYISKTEDSRRVREVLTVDYIDGIWKVRLPQFFSQYR